MAGHEVVLARFPVGISVSLFTALGGLVDAALADCGELLLGESETPQDAARLLLRSDLSQGQVAAALRGASRAIDPDRAREAAEAVAVDDVDDGIAVGHMRAHHGPDGDEGVSFGFGGPTVEDHAPAVARELLAVLLGVMDGAGVRNYLAWEVTAPDGRWELVVRRPHGLTPHEKQARYEQVLSEIAGGKRSPRVLAREVLVEMRAPRREEAS